ncbi:MAG: hypothetical protein MR374_10165 [Clostridia bacterium]|nr:hypothetical protein [Clostridia bacterium]
MAIKMIAKENKRRGFSFMEISQRREGEISCNGRKGTFFEERMTFFMGKRVTNGAGRGILCLEIFTNGKGKNHYGNTAHQPGGRERICPE